MQQMLLLFLAFWMTVDILNRFFFLSPTLNFSGKLSMIYVEITNIHFLTLQNVLIIITCYPQQMCKWTEENFSDIWKYGKRALTFHFSLYEYSQPHPQTFWQFLLINDTFSSTQKLHFLNMNSRICSLFIFRKSSLAKIVLSQFCNSSKSFFKVVVLIVLQ